MATGRNFQAHLARKAAKRNKAASEEKPLWQRLDEMPVPLRLIYGRQDRAAEQRVAAARERYPALDIHLLDRCGHLVQWDARARFAELAGSFFA
jgi:pimeloyl-ACP methyl ester carboxylesterase